MNFPGRSFSWQRVLRLPIFSYFYFAFRPGKAFVLRCVLIPIGTLFADFLAYLLFLQETFETSGDRWYVIAFWTAVVCAGIMTFFSCYLSKRTEYGTQILGRILGFKISWRPWKKIVWRLWYRMIRSTFYEILPYTYVLDISDKWIKKFDSIAIEAPDWYSGYNNTVFGLLHVQSLYAFYHGVCQHSHDFTAKFQQWRRLFRRRFRRWRWRFLVGAMKKKLDTNT